MLKDSTRTDLKNELERTERRSRLIRELLGELEELVITTSEIKEKAQESLEKTQKPFGSGNGKSLAAKIRVVLANANRPSSPVQIAQMLENNGVTRSGRKSKLSVIVGVELHRMSKRNIGGVKRVRKGFYKIYRQIPNDPVSSRG